MGPIVLDKCVRFRGHSINSSQEIPPEAVRIGIFDSFFRYYFRPEVDNDVISGVAADNVGMDVWVKFGDSRSKGQTVFEIFQELFSCRTNERDQAYPNSETPYRHFA